MTMTAEKRAAAYIGEYFPNARVYHVAGLADTIRSAEIAAENRALERAAELFKETQFVACEAGPRGATYSATQEVRKWPNGPQIIAAIIALKQPETEG